MKPPSTLHRILFSLIMSLMMGTCMSGLLTFIHTGYDPEFFSRWAHGFKIAVPIAFVMVSIFAPLAQKIVGFIIGKLEAQKI